MENKIRIALLSSLAAASLTSFAGSGVQVMEKSDCCHRTEFFIGLDGGYTFNNDLLVPPETGVTYNFIKMKQPWGGRINTGLAFMLTNNTDILFSVSGGYYGYYKDIYNVVSLKTGDAYSIGIDMLIGPKFVFDNFYFSAQVGTFFAKVGDFQDSPNTDITVSYPYQMFDLNPEVKVELGMNFNAWEIGISYSFIHNLYSSGNGNFDNEIVPLYQPLFIGFKYFWN